MVSREQREEAVRIGKEFISERRSCKVFDIHRSVFRHEHVEKDTELEKEIRSIAMKKRRYGYRRIYNTLIKKRKVNHKKVYRIYTQMGLKYRIKRKKKRFTGESRPLIIPGSTSKRWSMDFVHDALYDGRKFRVLNIIDDYSREAICLQPDFSINGRRVVRILEELRMIRPLPEQIVVDNGPEFTSKVFLKWADENNVDIHFIEKGKPTQNAFVESFNGKFRDECLNEEWFVTIKDARNKIEVWRNEYNTERPHSSLNGLTPYEFIGKSA
ncbi:MAG: IS3 family transposase [Spirochaetes bacterium]|nr:IS3 family transposase [Spirochaetota bacterium]